MPKLHNGHIKTHKIRKMKVKLAAPVLSRTVSSFIRLLTCITGTVQTTEGVKSMPIREGVNTSEVIKFLNDSFDSLNGRKEDIKSTKNALRSEVTGSSCHSTFWKQASHCMANNIRFVDKGTRKVRTVPSLKNFILTINGFRRLWRDLQQMGFKCFSPRNLNQDPLKNFFEMIRSHGGCNTNPTPLHFQSSFKTLPINNLTSGKTARGNCEQDKATALFSLYNFALIAQNTENNSNSIEAEQNDNQYIISQNNDSYPSGTGMDISVILTKLCADNRFKSCCTCVSDLCNIDNFNILFKEAYDNLNANIAHLCFKNELLKNLIMPLSVALDFSFLTCTQHFQPLCEAISKSFAVEYITCWCRHINRLLKGKNSVGWAEEMLAKQARIQHVKHCRHKKTN